MDTGRAGRGVYRIPTYRHGRTALRPQRLNAHRPIRNTDLGRRGRGATGPDTAEAATGVRRWWRRSGGCKSSAWRTRHRWAVRVVVTRVRAALCVDRALSEPLSVQPRGAGASGPQPARNGTRRPNGQMRLGEWRVRRVVVASRSGSGRYDKCGGAPVTCRVRESTVAASVLRTSGARRLGSRVLRTAGAGGRPRWTTWRKSFFEYVSHVSPTHHTLASSYPPRVRERVRVRRRELNYEGRKGIIDIFLPRKRTCPSPQMIMRAFLW